MQADDGGMLRLIANGDRAAFRELVDDVGPRALALAIRVTANRQLAEEAVQEAFLDVWTKAGRYDASRGGLRQWVLTLVHHKAVDAVRRESVAARMSAQAPLPDTVDDPELLGVAADETVRVRKSLGALPDDQRRAIELAYFDGLTYREVADHLHIPEGTAKSRLRTGLAALRGLLESNGVVWGQT